MTAAQEPLGGALALPDAEATRGQMAAIKAFQAAARATMVEGQDYGVIPGTRGKPTLLKPGAEKILKLLNLAESYEVFEEWQHHAEWAVGQDAFYRCRVATTIRTIDGAAIVAGGVGCCNSREEKYRKRDGSWLSPYSQENTILKIAKKRSMVDAALSVSRLSEIFTQDLEDVSRGKSLTPPPMGSSRGKNGR